MVLLTEEKIMDIIKDVFTSTIPIGTFDLTIQLLKAQLKKAINWGSEYCELQNRPRRECGHCWQVLHKEVEL